MYIMDMPQMKRDIDIQKWADEIKMFADKMEELTGNTITLEGLNASITVLWNYQAPEGGGDTHYCEMRGTKADITIRQTAEQNWKPELYIEAVNPAAGYEDALKARFAELEKKYPGIKLEKMSDGAWHVFVPDSYRNGHEAHFGQVTENFLQYFADGKLPDWEQPNMITKYYTTTEAYKIANGR